MKFGKFSLVLMPYLILFVSCKKDTDSAFNYCEYANKNPNYSFMYSGEEITKCTIIQKDLIKEDALGTPVVTHSVKLDLEITLTKDDCNSDIAMKCSLSPNNEGCLKTTDGNPEDYCKYPDKVVIRQRGTIKKIKRALSFVEDGNKLVVTQNKEMK